MGKRGVFSKMLTKKAQSNTFWIIIGAVIALIVMIVLLIMFNTQGNILQQGLVDCVSKGGECKTECTGDDVEQSFFSCKDDLVCCIGPAQEDE